MTTERPAPTTPDHRPSDDELRAIVYGNKQFVNDGSPEEPDEIAYEHPRGTWVTTRDERARATQIWHEEGQLPHPNNAEANLRRTEEMLRFRLRHMGSAEIPNAVPDLLVAHEERVRQAEASALHAAASKAAPQSEPAWVGAETGQFTPAAEAAPQEPAQNREYTGRHRERRIRVPLHRLIRHGRSTHAPRHAAAE